MKKHLKRITFKDFRLFDGAINSSVFKQYYCRDDTHPIEWDLVLKYYGRFPDPNQKEKWKLEIRTGGKGELLNINFEEESTSPYGVIEAYNNSRDLIYKMCERVF